MTATTQPLLSEPTPPTPITWWEALSLSGLFALAPTPLLFVIAALIGKLRGLSFQDAQVALLHTPAVFALVSVLSVIAPLWLVRQRLPRPTWAQSLAFKGVPAPVIGVAMVTGAALQLPMSEVANWVEQIAPVDAEQKQYMAELLRADTWNTMLQLALSVVIAAPLCEEVLFRGVVLRGLQRVHGPLVALALSSVLFGAAHAGLHTAVLPAALAGVACGALTLRYRSIVPSMALHAAVNAVPVLVTQARLPIAGFNTFDLQVRHISPLWLMPSLLIAALGLRWLLRYGGGAAGAGAVGAADAGAVSVVGKDESAL